MLDAMISALEIIFSWPNFLFVVLGTFIGVVFGAIPGLGGSIALALLIPVTFGWDAGVAMVLFGAVLGGLAFGGSIPAILINTPGMGPNVVTCFDGYPMSRQGRASEAIGVAATASAAGAILGLIFLILVLPVARRIILAFGPPEFFWVAIFGLVIIVVVSRGHLVKGLIAGGVGLLFSFVGYYPATAETRYGFGIQYLWDGIQLVPALIGLFAIAEIIRLIREGGTIAQIDTVDDKGSTLTGIKYVFTRPVLFLRSTAIGTLVGLVPGAGATIAIFISYMQAVQTSDDPDSFGQGNPAGILAAEAANDAKDGGALLPTVVFGIPGSPVMAVLLGAFILHGLSPGQALLNEDLNVLFMLIFALIAANILTSLFGIVTSKQLNKITYISVELLVPVILSLCLVGAYAIRGSLGDVIVAIGFGYTGYLMARYNYSRVAVVLALILGPMAEREFHLAMQISDNGAWIFLTRPISALLVVLTVFTLALPYLRDKWSDLKRRQSET